MTDANPTPAAPASPDKRAQTESVLAQLLSLMGYPARLDFKDVADGGISVAMHFDGEVPFAPAGKRSSVVDSMQFLLNKVVNRPNTERRWISLGVGAHPEPRPPQASPALAPQAPAPTGSKRGNGAATPVNGARAANPGRPQAPVSSAPRPAPRASPSDEASLAVSEDPALARLGALLAEKSVRHGRFFGVMLMDTEDRARLLKAAAGVKGVTARAEGEGFNRRVAFVPANPTPMPKKNPLPVVDDDEGEDEA